MATSKDQVQSSQNAVQTADIQRGQSITNYTDAFAIGLDGDPLAALGDTAISNEEGYQSKLDKFDDISDLYTSDVADSVGLGDLGDFGFDDFGTGGADSADVDSSDIVVTGQRGPADRRIRITPMDLGSFFSSGSSPTDSASDRTQAAAAPGIMAPLKATNGVIFPYTPTITYEHTANYQPLSPTHANTDYYIYQNTNAVKIAIQSQFTAQTDEEAKYMVAAMHMFRSATKMHFGKEDQDRGFGPPVLYLNGYGTYMFSKLPVIVTSFQMDLPPNVDYVTVDINGSPVSIPTLTTFNIQLVVQQTPAKQREEFSWEAFASGELLSNGGWI